MLQTTAERIARVLAERIVSGELAPGVRLRQDRVAEEFESSYVPAREAFQLLRAQGLLISEPRRGMRVAPLDHASMQEIVEIRASLEVLALTHAAPKLNAAPDKIERAVGWRASAVHHRMEQANRAFHRELVAPDARPLCHARRASTRQFPDYLFRDPLRRLAAWLEPCSSSDCQRFEEARFRQGRSATSAAYSWLGACNGKQ
jgi:DNA-binding GntR family transcriptional regulator